LLLVLLVLLLLLLFMSEVPTVLVVLNSLAPSAAPPSAVAALTKNESNVASGDLHTAFAPCLRLVLDAARCAFFARTMCFPLHMFTKQNFFSLKTKFSVKKRFYQKKNVGFDSPRYTSIGPVLNLNLCTKSMNIGRTVRPSS
jgi:hypothetical protein